MLYVKGVIPLLFSQFMLALFSINNIIKFICQSGDFEYFINNFTNEKTIIFLDPPYYLEKQSKLYGNNGDMHENFNHQMLFDLIKTKKNWIITYNNCEYIKNLYKDYLIIDVNWSYGMNKTKSSSEIIILSK